MNRKKGEKERGQLVKENEIVVQKSSAVVAGDEKAGKR